MKEAGCHAGPLSLMNAYPFMINEALTIESSVYRLTFSP